MYKEVNIMKDINEDPNVKTTIESDFIKGYKVRDGKTENYKAHLVIKADEEEMLYYIGSWKSIKLLAKRDKEAKKITYAVIKDNRGIHKETTKEKFDEFLINLKLRFGEPDNERDFINCKTPEEQDRILKKGNILED